MGSTHVGTIGTFFPTWEAALCDGLLRKTTTPVEGVRVAVRGAVAAGVL